MCGAMTVHCHRGGCGAVLALGGGSAGWKTIHQGRAAGALIITSPVIMILEMGVLVPVVAFVVVLIAPLLVTARRRLGTRSTPW